MDNRSFISIIRESPLLKNRTNKYIYLIQLILKQHEILFSTGFKMLDVLKNCKRFVKQTNYVKWRVSTSASKLITISRNVLETRGNEYGTSLWPTRDCV